MALATGKRQRVSGMDPSLLDLASDAGLLALNPSDLVFESSQLGIAYYDYVLSVSELPSLPLPSARLSTKPAPVPSSAASSVNAPPSVPPAANVPSPAGFRLFLAKLDSRTNVEWFETATVPGELLAKNQLPATELAMVILGVLIWRHRVTRTRLLCLVNQLNGDCSAGLEVLKRAALKFKCVHHVLTIGPRRTSTSSTGSWASYGSRSARSSISSNSNEGMKLRVMMCQSRNVLSELPAQSIREARFLLVPSTNPFFCLCFPLT